MNPQELPITIRFKAEHKPGNEQHLAVITERYLQAKGVTFNREELVIEI